MTRPGSRRTMTGGCPTTPRVFAFAIDSGKGSTLFDVNLRRYSVQLDLGSNLAIGNWLRDIYRNLVVSMLVRTAATPNVSGMARDVPREPPDQARGARVAFGANTIHEFSHAFGLLSDEYIDGRGTQSTRSNPRPRASSRSRTCRTPTGKTLFPGPPPRAGRAIQTDGRGQRAIAACRLAVGGAGPSTRASGTRSIAA